MSIKINDNKIDIKIVLSIFEDTYVNDPYLSVLRETALRNGLNGVYFRSIAWRVWLRILPTPLSKQWIQIMKEHRERYDKLTEKYYFGNSPQVIEGISSEDREDILHRIRKDIDRLFNMYDYFTDIKLREKISRILYIYACEHSNMNYQQGFHELVALFYKVIDTDFDQTTKIKWQIQTEISNEWLDLVTCLMDKKYTEHDSYVLFEYLMKQLGYVYEIKINRDKRQASAIQKKSEELFEQLSKVDILYYEFLTSHEFHIDDVIQLWDALFAFGNNLKLIDGIFLSMIIYLRKDIIERDDPSYTIRRLMRYPPVHDLREIIELGIAMTGNYEELISAEVYSHNTIDNSSHSNGTNSNEQENKNETIETVSSRMTMNPIKEQRMKRKQNRALFEKSRQTQQLHKQKKLNLNELHQQKEQFKGMSINDSMSLDQQQLITLYNQLLFYSVSSDFDSQTQEERHEFLSAFDSQLSAFIDQL